MQPRYTDKLGQLQKEVHIGKMTRCSDKTFISLILIAVRKKQSIKLALDSKVLKTSIHKNKYQMPIVEILVDFVSQHLPDT